MNLEELKRMKLLAELTLRVADAEGWTKLDASRLLAELALKAVEQLTNQEAHVTNT